MASGIRARRVGGACFRGPQLCFRLRCLLHARAEMREAAPQQQPATSGSIHIEFPGRALISVESGADPALLRSILESLRK